MILFLINIYLQESNWGGDVLFVVIKKLVNMLIYQPTNI